MTAIEHVPPGRFLAELRDVAAVRADCTAISDEQASFTYAELVTEIDRRAQRLVDAGVRPGDRIALVAENSGYFLVSAFAVWRAGAVLVTIYPSAPVADLGFCLADADPVLALADTRTEAAVRAAVCDELPVAVIDGAFEATEVRSGRRPNPDGLREPLHLICYSSGTTSRPKAIMISESAVCNAAEVFGRTWRMTAEDRTIVALPMAWLFGLASTSMTTLLRGGTVITLRRSRPELIIDAITRHRATMLPGVTTMFTKLVAHLESLADKLDLSSLRFCVSGGEPRNEVAFGRWQALTGCPVYDNFCASECFPFVTYDPVLDPQPVHGSAGKVVPGSSVRVVDADGNDVPPGEVGEAWTSGPGLMLGYWNDEEQTRKALTADGWYRTKDLIRIDADGYVYVVGRVSDMIIRGGSNVSPAEVERVLREHSSVHDVCVVGLPDEIYGQQVAAAVVPADTDIDTDAVRAFAAERLAAFKVPTVYRVIDALPLNPRTDKVDRRAVAELLQSQGA
ncbi:class I adenylate-forming enzyme family protein [uncultured Mycolicibacterium sp.]|uniref:class I adenylate-forming enzyme family protein n=1 Tax=uncultured Mycolicibacterium sp. TaxID=2320817 RepID=UPI00261AABE9|nr:class I adenylate-forming enzyme family protein [uncultured Mycolicibacterium sp.]